MVLEEVLLVEVLGRNLIALAMSYRALIFQRHKAVALRAAPIRGPARKGEESQSKTDENQTDEYSQKKGVHFASRRRALGDQLG